MAAGQKRNVHVVTGAHRALDNMKYEIASELGLSVQQGSEDYWGQVLTRDAGAVGGHITRRLVEIGEQALAGQNSQA